MSIEFPKDLTESLKTSKLYDEIDKTPVGGPCPANDGGILKLVHKTFGYIVECSKNQLHSRPINLGESREIQIERD